MLKIHEFLVLKSDGKVEHFPVESGDVGQAKIRASLCQHPGDRLVVVTDDAFVRVQPPDVAE